MTTSLTATQLLGVMLASMGMGAGLLMVLVDRIARLWGDDSCSGCLGLGLVLTLLAATATALILTP